MGEGGVRSKPTGQELMSARVVQKLNFPNNHGRTCGVGSKT